MQFIDLNENNEIKIICFKWKKHKKIFALLYQKINDIIKIYNLAIYINNNMIHNNGHKIDGLYNENIKINHKKLYNEYDILDMND